MRHCHSVGTLGNMDIPLMMMMMRGYVNTITRIVKLMMTPQVGVEGSVTNNVHNKGRLVVAKCTIEHFIGKVK